MHSLTRRSIDVKGGQCGAALRAATTNGVTTPTRAFLDAMLDDRFGAIVLKNSKIGLTKKLAKLKSNDTSALDTI